MAVSVEKEGPVTIVTLSRPEVRNAVDRETAEALSDAFRAFESDASARVAVFSGNQGHFCFGADLNKIASGTPNRVEPDGDSPMGPARMQLKKPARGLPDLLKGPVVMANSDISDPIETKYKRGQTDG